MKRMAGRRAPMVRRASALVLVVASCSDGCPPCREGINLSVDRLSGTLGAGYSMDVEFCVDAKCTTVTVASQMATGTIFVPVDGLTDGGDHHLTVTGPGGVSGDYTGPIEVIDQAAAADCECGISTVKVLEDGTIEPGQVVVSPDVTAPAASG